MKVDERFMTILTALFVIVGVGAVMQRGENGASLLGGSGRFVPKADSFTVRGDRVQSLDVLLNDLSVDRVDPSDLIIVQRPDCGTALVTNGAIQYSSSATCDGAVVLTYCVPFEGECEVVPVTLTVIGDPAERRSLATARNADGSPVVVDDVAQGSAPEDRAEALALRQPKRLSLPTDSEVITPSEATADLRELSRSTSRAVAAAEADNSANVNVARGSARSGSVSVVGAELSQPQAVEQSAGVAIASAGSRPSQSLRSAPAGFGGGLSAPASPDTPTFQPPAPLGSDFAPTLLSEPTPPTPGPRPPREVARTDDTPEAGDNAGTFETAAIDPGASDRAGLKSAPEPMVDGPAALDIDLPETVTATPDQGQSGTEIAALPSADAPVAGGEGPAAQTEQPQASAAPETDDAADRSLISSLARSNTVLGATISAAEALFGPREVEAPTSAEVEVTSAPRPKETKPVDTLDFEAAGIELTAGELNLEPDTRPEAGPPPILTAALGSQDVAPYERRTNEALTPLQVLLGMGGSGDANPAAVAPRPSALGGTALPEAPAGGNTSAPTPLPQTGTELAALPQVGDALPGTGGLNAPSAGSLTAPRPEFGARPLPRTGSAPAPSAPSLVARPTPPTPSAPSFGSGSAPRPVVNQPVVEPLPRATAGATLRLPAPVPGLAPAACDIDLVLQPQGGAELLGSLSSPCRPNERFLVEHEGLAFTAETDSDGVANFYVPAMKTNAIVSVTFTDGGQEIGRATVEFLARMSRVAVVWNDEVDVNLHALEFGAVQGSDGDVSAENARNFRLARRIGGGYLVQLGLPDGDGVRAEVYTLIRNARTAAGAIDFRVNFQADAGACNTDPVVRVVRSEQASISVLEDHAVDLDGCEPLNLVGADLGIAQIAIASSN